MRRGPDAIGKRLMCRTAGKVTGQWLGRWIR
jgi:hypothetical protein